MNPRNGHFEFNTYPNTGCQLNGSVLPFWEELLNFTFKVHHTFNIIFIGWDIALTDDGFVVVEGNTIWGLDVIESPQKKALFYTKYPSIYNQWIKKHQLKFN